MNASTGQNSRFSASFLSSSLIAFLLLQPIVTVAAVVPAPESAPATDRNIRQVINRLTFGAKPGDFDAVKKMGYEAFIESQLNPGSIDDSVLTKRLEKLPTLMLATPTIAEQYNPPKPPPTPTPSPATSPASSAIAEGKRPESKMEPVKTIDGNVENSVAVMPKPSPTPAPKPTPVPKNPYQVVTQLQQAKLLRAVYSERQLYEVMVDFWENHFSIYANKDADRWLLTGFDRDSVRPFAMGRFRDLLGATAHSPAMLFYLDNWTSSVLHEYPATKDKPARKSGGINENYARELMELHTLGVDGGYTQKDVQEVARCFTGWTIRKPNEEGVFVYNPAQHDNGEKIVLGQKIPAGGGIADGERVLDILAKSPATARFVVTKMARRFLGDNPPTAAMDRAAKVFLRTDGSITETLRSIITGPEFFSAATYQNKVKSPFEFVASALRITNAETDANQPILSWITRMGQPVYGRVTPDGYPDKTTEWLSNNDLLSRFNFAGALVMNTIKGTSMNVGKLVNATNDPSKSAAEIERIFLMGQASDQTLAALEKLAAVSPKPDTQNVPVALPQVSAKWTDPVKPDNGETAHLAQLIALALGTPEFQRK